MTHPEGLDKQILEAVNQTVYLSPPLSLFPSATASLMFLPAFSSFNPSIFSRNVLSLPSQEEQAIWQGDFMEGNCKETVCHTMWGVFFMPHFSFWTPQVMTVITMAGVSMSKNNSACFSLKNNCYKHDLLSLTYPVCACVFGGKVKLICIFVLHIFSSIIYCEHC